MNAKPNVNHRGIGRYHIEVRPQLKILPHSIDIEADDLLEAKIVKESSSILTGRSLLNYAAYKPHPHHEIMKQQLTSFETSGAGTHHTPGINPGTQATLLLSPITARDLNNQGFGSKEQLSQWLKRNTHMTLWNYWAAMPGDPESARAGIEPFASLLKLPPEAKSPRPLILQDAPIEVVVVGGGTDAFWMAGDFFCLASASVDRWR